MPRKSMVREVCEALQSLLVERGVSPRTGRFAPPSAPGECSVVALFMLGADMEDAREELESRGLNVNDVRGIQNRDAVDAAQALFGPFDDLVARPGMSAKEFAVAHSDDPGGWLLMTREHMMATAGGSLWNRCGFGRDDVVLAVHFPGR